MPNYTLLAVGGLIVLLLGTLAFLGGLGQYQAEGQFDDRLADDQGRFDQTNAASGYEVCMYDNNTASLVCPDNPYTGSIQWLVGGLVAIAIGGATIYYDVENRA